MGCLDMETMVAWYGLLPGDVASAMDAPDEEGRAAGELVSSRMQSLAAGADAVALVEQNSESFVEMGRARRLRFLAWLAARDYPDGVEALRSLTETGEDGEGTPGGGTEKVAPYFKEDIRALVAVLGPRVARGMAGKAALAAVAGAGYEVAGELEMRSGGGA